MVGGEKETFDGRFLKLVLIDLLPFGGRSCGFRQPYSPPPKKSWTGLAGGVE